MCVCVCVCVRARARVCVCVCVTKIKFDLYKECTVVVNTSDTKIFQIRPKSFGVDTHTTKFNQNQFRT
jgi:hypothetical protein